MRGPFYLSLILRELRLFLFPTPHFKFAVKRADRIDKDQQKDGVFRTIQVTDTPGDRDNRQVDQVRVE